ncbi:MAG: MBL fold metallo-hydrolase, partial [Ignavibacteriaceae bacterium]
LSDGRVITITATPCRHGPVGGDRGPVIGFIINFKNDTDGAVYISGDTVLYDGVEEVARKFKVRLILLFMGKAIVKEVGYEHLTMTAKEAVEVAKIFPKSKIIPLHFEGWKHFSESKEDIYETFKKLHLLNRLIWIN